MWGWKSVERFIDNVPYETAKKYIVDEFQFFEKKVNESYSIFQRSGTQLTIHGKNFPLELAFAKKDHGIFLQLRYDFFMFFDTGDLSRFADEIIERLTAERTVQT